VGLLRYREAHLVRVFPSRMGASHWWPWGPSSFLRLTWSGDSLHWLEMWRGQSYAFSQWLCLQSVSPASLQDFTIGGSLSACVCVCVCWQASGTGFWHTHSPCFLLTVQMSSQHMWVTGNIERNKVTVVVLLYHFPPCPTPPKSMTSHWSVLGSHIGTDSLEGGGIVCGREALSEFLCGKCSFKRFLRWLWHPPPILLPSVGCGISFSHYWLVM
jgi:hypothetical protein